MTYRSTAPVMLPAFGLVFALALVGACGSTGGAATTSDAGTGTGGGVSDEGGDAGGGGPAACGPTARKLADMPNALSIAGDVSNVYAAARESAGDTIWRVPKSGAAPVAIA